MSSLQRIHSLNNQIHVMIINKDMYIKKMFLSTVKKKTFRNFSLTPILILDISLSRFVFVFVHYRLKL